MILYFSGTGNSRYTASTLSRILDENMVFIPDADPSTLEFSGRSLGFVFPVYSWGVPPIVLDFIERLNGRFISHADDLPVWTVMTCGDETGEAPLMLRQILEKRGLKLSGGWSLTMPNVYVLLPGFNVDSKEVEISKLDKAPDRLRKIGERIGSHRWEFDYTTGSFPHLRTSLIYPLFRRWGINPRKFRWDKECVSCGRCARACPVGNIIMQNDHPHWGDRCTSCLACYHTCPVKAIDYGKRTTNKGQYLCHLK